MSRWFNVDHAVIGVFICIRHTPKTSVWAHGFLFTVFIVHHWNSSSPGALHARLDFCVFAAFRLFQIRWLFTLVLYFFLMESIKHSPDLVYWLMKFCTSGLFPLIEGIVFCWFFLLRWFDSLVFHKMVLGFSERVVFDWRLSILSWNTFLWLRYHIGKRLRKRFDWRYAWSFCAFYSLRVLTRLTWIGLKLMWKASFRSLIRCWMRR